jgi:hypothetical protein
MKKKAIKKNKSAPDRTFEKTPSKSDETGQKQVTDAEVDKIIQQVRMLTYGQVLVVKKAASERLATVR